MKGENISLRNKLKGYLFEIAILKLLTKNGFSVVEPYDNNKDRVKENRKGFIEIKGRGAWHQIDCPCDYDHAIPFSYPIRMLGEVKFHENPIEKHHIREFIGVIKDIQENYFVSAESPSNITHERKIEIGTFFSANGFNKSAEGLAYAHGIRTISYQNNFAVKRIKDIITKIESDYISVDYISKGRCKDFLNWFNHYLESIDYHNLSSEYIHEPRFKHLMADLSESLMSIRSSFIATTVTGVFLHFIGDNTFPEELFEETDEGQCRIYFDRDDANNRYFRLQFFGDNKRRRFYFSPPRSLDEAAMFGGEHVLDEKERHFGTLNVSIKIRGINRNLTLHVDKEWLKHVRDGI